jgi:hypothetical protein
MELTSYMIKLNIVKIKLDLSITISNYVLKKTPKDTRKRKLDISKDRIFTDKCNT